LARQAAMGDNKEQTATAQAYPQPKGMPAPAGRSGLSGDTANTVGNTTVPAPRPIPPAPTQLANPGAQLAVGQAGGRGGAGNRTGDNNNDRVVTNYANPRHQTVSEAMAEATRGRAENALHGKGQSQFGMNPPGLPNTLPQNPPGASASVTP